MTFTEAMTEARAEAERAQAEAKTQGMDPQAFTVGWLTACLAGERCRYVNALAELKRHQSFIKAQ